VTAILLPNGKQQYFTTAGLPAVGYKVATFAAGTSTPQTTWQDALKVAQQTNPIILDGRGEASIFWDGAYKVQLQDSTGAVIWTQDNLQSQQNSFAATLVPSVTNSVDLGSVTLSWRNLYLGANNAPVLDTVSGNIGYYARTLAETAASVTPANFAYGPDHIGDDVRRYGNIDLTGATDCRAILNTANSVGVALYLPKGIYKISSALTLNVPLYFEFGAILKPDAAVTVTINAPVWAGPWQIFNLSNAGAALAGILIPMLATGRILAEWFGAKGDNATDDTVAIQNALLCARNSGFIGVQLLLKAYKVTTSLYLNGLNDANFSSCSLFGTANNGNIVGGSTQITCTGFGGNPVLVSKGGSGNQPYPVIQDIWFSGDSTTGACIQFLGRCGATVYRCVFYQAAIGIWFSNNVAAGTFTEYCHAYECSFTNCSTAAIRYTRGSGDTSFNGTGLYQCKINIPLGIPAVLIDAGATPYNAPFYAQIWTANTGPNTIFQNNGGGNCSYHGQLTLEGGNTTNNLVSLGAGSVVMFAGNVNTNSNNCVSGTLAQCRNAAVFAGGEAVWWGTKVSAQALTTGTNNETTPPFFAPAARIVHVATVATGYDYRYVLLVLSQGTGGFGNVTTLATFANVNTAGYGASTFNEFNGQLRIINAAFPASGVSGLIESSQISSGMPYVATSTTVVQI
jgi:hypothetical protein